MNFEPIGFFQSDAKYPYDVPRQPDLLVAKNEGVIVLNAHHNYEQALEDLEGFSHIWVIFAFHKNAHWSPKALPPRGEKKRGLFATRSPYRPNPIGISAVQLIGMKGLKIYISGHDLLDGTPILDIKPYIYADSVSPIKQGWLEEEIKQPWHVQFSEKAMQQIEFLKAHGGPDCLESFLREQLSCAPFRKTRKRIKCISETIWEIAYRTWRVTFTVDEKNALNCVQDIASGYAQEECDNMNDDPYHDKKCHQTFIQWKAHFKS